MSYIDYELAQLNIFEGDILHCYLDTATPPNVTIGKGTLIPNLTAMQTLPWKHPRTLTLATGYEVVQEWNRVRAMRGGLVAAAYDAPDALMLTASDIDDMTEKTLLSIEGDLRRVFPEYDSFPDTAKVGLLDMGWNLGIGKLRSEYIHFCASVKAQEWVMAAAECARNVHDAAFNHRNDWTRQMFVDAADGIEVKGW